MEDKNDVVAQKKLDLRVSPKRPACTTVEASDVKKTRVVVVTAC
jgi:hypothetical protein